MKEFFSIDLNKAADALTFIDSTDRETWVAMAGAMKSEFGEAGFDTWDYWSSGASNYNKKAALSVWKSIRPFGSDKTATIASLIYLAKESGFEIEADALTDEQKKQHQKAREEKQKLREKEWQQQQIIIQQQQRQTAQLAQTIWRHHTSKGGQSEYLDNKKVRPFNIRFIANALIVVNREDDQRLIQGSANVSAFYNSEDKDAGGFHHFKSGCLVVPMFDETKEIQNLQIIKPSGIKTFLKNGRKKGCFHVIGDISNSKVILFAEGYSTAASLHQATELPVVIAFDSGNLPPVAKSIKKLFPDSGFVVCGDDDVDNEKNPGRKKALAAAEAIGGVAVFPCFTSQGVCADE